MKKKVYITIEIPEEVKWRFRKEESRWKNLKIFWLGAQSLRVNFMLLGILDKKQLQIVTDTLQEITSNTPEWVFLLDKLTLGPNTQDPTMFWVTLKETNAAHNFKEAFKQKLIKKGFLWNPKLEGFKPHIVLAAARGNQLKGKQTNVSLQGEIPVRALNLVLTQTYERGKVKHKLWESFPLKTKS